MASDNLNSLFNFPSFEDLGTPPCAETDPEAFFSHELFDGARKAVYTQEAEAKAICKACPYVAACLQAAMDVPETQGIWGGTTERDRMLIRRRAGMLARAKSKS